MKKGTVAFFSAIGGALLAAAGVAQITKHKIADTTKMSEKHFNLYMLMNQWVKVKQSNKSIARYFEEKGFKEIAIYGMNYVGETLLSEMAGSEVTVKYGIDKNAERIYQDIDVVLPDDAFDDVDAVIVTAVTFFDEIEETLSQKVNCPILSLEDILCEI